MALTDVLENLRDLQELNEDDIASDPGPLQEPEKSVVSGRISDSEDLIGDALTLINNVGTADTSNPPTTLPGYADRMSYLGHLAFRAASQTPPLETVAGDCIKTMQYLCPGMKTLAGIT